MGGPRPGRTPSSRETRGQERGRAPGLSQHVHPREPPTSTWSRCEPSSRPTLSRGLVRLEWPHASPSPAETRRDALVLGPRPDWPSQTGVGPLPHTRARTQGQMPSGLPRPHLHRLGASTFWLCLSASKGLNRGQTPFPRQPQAFQGGQGLADRPRSRTPVAGDSLAGKDPRHCTPAITMA